MPTGANDSLQKLYDLRRLLSDEATSLEKDRDQLDGFGKDADRYYILELEIAALRQEASRIDSRISDILERDLQR
jgi:hypothetical protein